MGGNIFKNKATSIPKNRIEPTIKAYKDALKNIFPMKGHSFNFFEPVGSAGKKPTSGDLDLAIDHTHIIRSFTGSEIGKWGIEFEDWSTKYEKIKKRSRTATDEMCKMRSLLTLISAKLTENNVDVGGQVTAGNIFTCFEQYDENGPTGDYVQIDWMVGDVDWLRWSYYSHGEKGLKGLHRTQLLVALFSEIGYTFSHFSGIKKKNTSEWTITSPEDALKMLSEHYGDIRYSYTQTFAKLHAWLCSCNSSLYSAVINRYKDILTKSRDIIPNRLKDVPNQFIEDAKLSGYKFTILEPQEAYNDAIVAFDQGRLVYDVEKLMDCMRIYNHWEYGTAITWFEYNILNTTKLEGGPLFYEEDEEFYLTHKLKCVTLK